MESLEPLGTLRGPTKLCDHSFVNKYAPRACNPGVLPCVLCIRQWGDTVKLATQRLMAHDLRQSKCKVGKKANRACFRDTPGRSYFWPITGRIWIFWLVDRTARALIRLKRTASSSVQRAKAYSMLWKYTRTLKPVDKNTDSSPPRCPQTYWINISGSEDWKL